MQYEIIQRLTLPCRIIEVQQKTNRQDGSQFIVFKLGEYVSGHFICSIITSKYRYDSLNIDMRNKQRHTIDKVAIKPQNNVYRILTWDDVDRGKCTRNHISEVERGQDGVPILYEQIVVYVNKDGKGRPTIDSVLSNDYIEENSPFVHNALNFNNRDYYLRQQEEKRDLSEREEHALYEEMLYNASEVKRCSNMDMSEGEIIMNALENGEGEMFGF